MDLATRKGLCEGWSESLVFRSVLKVQVIWPQSAFSNFYKPFFKKKKLLLAPICGAKNSGNTIGQWQSCCDYWARKLDNSPAGSFLPCDLGKPTSTFIVHEMIYD